MDYLILHWITEAVEYCGLLCKHLSDLLKRKTFEIKDIIMDVNEFREFGRAAIDFVADYLENIRDRCANYN